MRRKLILLALLALILSTSALAQRLQTEFGKNRVQYHDDFKEWMQYESPNFVTYWYGEGRNIGQAVVQLAELDYEYIQSILEHSMNDKIEIIVYTDVTDLKQSNIGNEETFVNTGGQTKIVENKVFVYFDGNHNNLRRDLREGIASVFLNAMLFGSNLQEIVQNAVLLNLPLWFKEGLISFVGEEWGTEVDNQLRDLMQMEEYQNFGALAEDFPKLAGHSMWYFISQNYGKSTVSNLLYLTRINRSIESGFLYVLGTPYERTAVAWSKYFKKRYEAESKNRVDPVGKNIVIKNKRNLPIRQVKISPDGKRIVYVMNEIGKYKVYVHDLETDKRKMIYKHGFKNPFQETDYAYPLLAWNPNNMELAILYERRDIPKLIFYDLKTGKKKIDKITDQYHRVYSIDYINPFNLVFSATVRGFSDIFVYKTKTRQTERITNDFYDDLDAAYTIIDGKKGILFASNRPDTLLTRKSRIDTILPINNFDIFYYNLEDKPKELIRVTNTPYTNERNPVGIDSTWLSYLSDESGLFNRHMAYLDSVFIHNNQIITLTDGTEITLHEDSTLVELEEEMIDTIVLEPVYVVKSFSHNNTNYNRSITTQHASRRTNQAVDLFYKGGRDQVYVYDVNPEQKVAITKTSFQDNRKKIAEEKIKKEQQAEAALQRSKTKPTLDKKIEQRKVDPAEDKVASGSLYQTEFSPKQDTVKPKLKKYLFQSEFEDPETGYVLNQEDEKPKKKEEVIEDPVIRSPFFKSKKTDQAQGSVHHFRTARIVPYNVKFRTDYVTTQLDNTPLFGGMDAVFNDINNQNSDFPLVNFQPAGILLKANFKDLFEDYEVEGGIRIPTTFNGAEYFLSVEDKKKRIDKRYTFYRRSLKFNDGPPSSIGITPRRKEQLLLTQAEFRYPLDIFNSIRVQGGLRLDKRIQLATDAASLNQATINQQRVTLRAEYVFDNTMNIDINIMHGTRWKVYAEAIKGLAIDLIDDTQFDLKDGFTTLLGFDARHYQRLDGRSIFAFRGAGATSFGSEKLLFYMGGVDNWLFPRREQFTNDPPNEEYAYQLIASNMRGFRGNIRNGTSFAMINAELRVPVFKYFKKNIRSSFFRNFQILGFYDAGTAWHGLTPYSDENPLNSRTVNISDIISVNVNYFKDPLIMGYGAGVRSVLFGYFIRLDYAWGLETRQVQDPILYLSLGTDF
ncbi:MAG: BamA/TamA family outer membrane protein [Saprospiraceae bacterium]